MLPQFFDTFYKDEFKDTKIVYMIHEINDFYDYDNDLHKKIGLGSEKNNIINGIKYSDYIYAFNDPSENSVADCMKSPSVKSVLKNKKYKLINYSSDMDTSDRIKVYNEILKDLKKS